MSEYTELDRNNPFATNDSGICAYCKDCYSCDNLNYDSYTYTDDNGGTMYDDTQECWIDSGDREIYQSNDDAAVWQKIYEKCTRNNDPLTMQVYNKYMEFLLAKID